MAILLILNLTRRYEKCYDAQLRHNVFTLLAILRSFVKINFFLSIIPKRSLQIYFTKTRVILAYITQPI